MANRKKPSQVSGSGVTVILISGKRCAGKDTFAQILKKYFEEKQSKIVHLTHFADECKRLFSIRSGTDYQRLLNDRVYKVSMLNLLHNI